MLVYTSSISGDGNTLAVTNNDASLDSISTSLNTILSANSASVDIDGITVTSDTNTFTDAIQDVTFTLLDSDVTTINLDVSLDRDGARDAISSFVDAVNDFQTIAQQLGQNSESIQGELAGDPTLRILTNQVRTAIQNEITGLTGNFTTLNSLGITFDEFGKLQIDDDTLDTVLQSDFSAIGAVFATENEGISIQLQELADNYIGSGGILDIRQDSLNEQRRRLETDRLNFDFRITQIETRLRQQFGAVDALVAQFNSTGQFLSQQLSNLPGPRTSSGG